MMTRACVRAIQFQQKTPTHSSTYIFDMHPIDQCDQIKRATCEQLLVLVLACGHQGEAPVCRSPLSGAGCGDPEYACHLEDQAPGFWASG